MYTIPKPRVAIFDIDKTTLNTDVLYFSLASSVSRLAANVNRAQFQREIKLFDINNAGYDMTAHLKTYGLPFEKVEPQLIADLSKVQLVYADAVDAFDTILDTPWTDYWNITVGIHDTQKFKIKLQNAELRRRLKRKIPSKNHLIISGNKGRYLTRHWQSGFKMGRKKYSSALVVDDNPGQLEDLKPAPGLKIYQIVRPRGLYEPTYRKDIIEISDLMAMVK
jgi:hypothetical protein